MPPPVPTAAGQRRRRDQPLCARQAIAHRPGQVEPRRALLGDADMGRLVAQDPDPAPAQRRERKRVGRRAAGRWHDPDLGAKNRSHQGVQPAGERIAAIGHRRAVVRPRNRGHHLGMHRGDVVAEEVASRHGAVPKPRRTAASMDAVWKACASRG